MIFPVPAGVDPNSHTCGCGGRLTMPWIHNLGERGEHILQCVVDHDHETYTAKNSGRTKMLAGPNGQKVEVDVLSQKPVEQALVTITDESTALVAVQRGNSIGLWPDRIDEKQMQHLAHVAYHYQMDIFMGELMPYQGKPFITIKGRRRYDKREGNRIGITFRMPRPDELAYWLEVNAMAQGDVIQIAVGTEPDGTVTEGFGRVLMAEQPTTEAGKKNLPIAVRKIEMAQKRGEARLREMVFGSIGKPSQLNPDVQVLGEDDASNVVEGSARVIEDPEPQTMPDFGECPEHGVAWSVEPDKFTGNPRATHFVGKDDQNKSVWCSVGTIYKTLFFSAWGSKFGEPKEKDVNLWLKEKFGNTWSKLAHLECVQAVDLLRVDPESGEVESQEEPVNDGGMPDKPQEQTPDDAPEGQQPLMAGDPERELDATETH